MPASRKKYQELRREVARLWRVNVTATHLVVGGFGYGGEERTKECSANRCDYKNGISAESGIAWNRKKFAKSS